MHVCALHRCLDTATAAAAAILLMASHNCYGTNIYIYNINILIAIQQFPNLNIRYIFNVLLSEL